MRNKIIDNLRALCMLGVIAIHTGSLALQPGNFTLYIILEVLSRYSVPSFFFISGYGLFCSLRLTDDGRLLDARPQSYMQFIKKRLLGSGLPYLSWSLLYLAYFWLVLPPGYISWQPLHLAFVLFFGLACYHLYFMVILLWFYALLPLWRHLLQLIVRCGAAAGLAALLIFQLAFNWWTTHPGIDSSSWPALARNFFNYRLNYLPLHYLLIFMCGALAAVYWRQFCTLLRKHVCAVLLFYAASIIWTVYSCWQAASCKNYSLIDLANTYHQLSPQGLIYTLASLAAFCLLLDWLENAQQKASAAKAKRSVKDKLFWALHKIISLLGEQSLLIYLTHPLLLDWLTSFYTKYGIVMTVKKVSFSYLLLVAGSFAFSCLISRLLRGRPLLSLLLTGRK